MYKGSTDFRRILLASFSFLTVLGGTIAVWAQQNSTLIQRGDLYFEDHPRCLKAQDVPVVFCPGKDLGGNSVQVGEPKEWTLEEIQKISAVIINMSKRHPLTKFFARLKSTGFNKLYRYKYAFVNQGGGQFSRVPLVMMVTLPSQGLLEVSDRYLAYNLKDPLGNFQREELSLLPELTHAFDGSGSLYSEGPEFLALTSWSVKPNGAWELLGFPALLQERQKFSEYVSSGHMTEAFKLSRGTSVKLGLASFAVLANPHEYFAETAATIFYDSNSQNYIDRRIFQWFQKYILL